MVSLIGLNNLLFKSDFVGLFLIMTLYIIIIIIVGTYFMKVSMVGMLTLSCNTLISGFLHKNIYNSTNTICISLVCRTLKANMISTMWIYVLCINFSNLFHFYARITQPSHISSYYNTSFLRG